MSSFRGMSGAIMADATLDLLQLAALKSDAAWTSGLCARMQGSQISERMRASCVLGLRCGCLLWGLGTAGERGVRARCRKVSGCGAHVCVRES